ncbi:MAG: protein kinase [Myxococcales bacterium]|nr:protein kinase [Myxococcales bacterium]
MKPVVAQATPFRVIQGGAATGAEVSGGLVGSYLGEYRLVEYIGRGGMADVYAAVRQVAPGVTGRFALKLFLRKLGEKERLTDLFFHEARLSTMLSHPNLVKGFDLGVADGSPYLVMELVDGVACDVFQSWGGAHPLPAPLALMIVSRVLGALDFVHNAADPAGRPLGIVHQDVSPDNVLVGRLGEVKLGDFGVAKSALGPSLPAPRLFGKIGYMSPEQVGGQPTDARSDLFSAGVVMAELLLGHRLFDRDSELELLVQAFDCEVDDSLAELQPRVRAATTDVLRRALARDPAARFQTAKEFERAVREAAIQLGDLPTEVDLIVWLLERGLVGKASGVRIAANARGRTAADVEGKIDAARLMVMTARANPTLGCAPERLTLRVSPSTFTVLEPNGRVAGGLSLAQLLGHLATGRFRAGAEVCELGGPPKPARSVAALRFTANAPAYQFDDAAEQRVAWRMPFERTRLPSLLFSLARTRATGLLALKAGPRHKRVYYQDGSPCFVASTEPSELFGRAVLAAGILDEDQLDEVVAWAAQQGRRLGDALVASGLAAAGPVLRLLVAQFEQRFIEIGNWVEGSISFTPGLRPGLRAPRRIGSAGSWPAAVVRRCYSDAEVEALVNPLRGLPLVLSGKPEEHDLGLLAHEHTVLARLEEPCELEALEQSLCRDGTATRSQAQRALFWGLSAGLVVSTSPSENVGFITSSS